LRSKITKRKIPDTTGTSKVTTILLVAVTLTLVVAGIHWIQRLVLNLSFTESVAIEKIWVTASEEKIFVHVTLVNKGNVPVQLDSILINDEPIQNYRGTSQGEFTTGMELQVGESKDGIISIPYEPPFREGMLVKFDVVTSTDNHYPFFITIPSKP